MPYAPTVNDRSGEILAQAKMQDNALRFAQQQQMWEAVGQGISSIGEGLGQMIQKKQEDAAKATSIGEALNTMQTVLPTYGPEGAALADALMQDIGSVGNNTDKMAGRWMAAQPIISNFMSRYNQQASIEGYKDLADYKAANAPASTTTAPKLDAQYGREFYMGLRNNGRTHQQALEDMRNAGLNWAINDIERPQNQGFFNMPIPAATPTGP